MHSQEWQRHRGLRHRSGAGVNPPVTMSPTPGGQDEPWKAQERVHSRAHAQLAVILLFHLTGLWIHPGQPSLASLRRWGWWRRWTSPQSCFNLLSACPSPLGTLPAMGSSPRLREAGCLSIVVVKSFCCSKFPELPPVLSIRPAWS